jgi:hypothetical protein
MAFLSDICWNVFLNWTEYLETQIEYLAEIDDAEEEQMFRARWAALNENADKDAGLGKLRFRRWGEEADGDILDLTGLTNKEVLNALAEYAGHLADGALGDHIYVEGLKEEGNFWVISWGS